jgi:hypothetical protein
LRYHFSPGARWGGEGGEETKKRKKSSLNNLEAKQHETYVNILKKK